MNIKSFHLLLIITLLFSNQSTANQDLDLAVDQWLAGITTQIEFEKKVQDLNINQKITAEDFEMIQVVYEQKKSQPTIILKPYESLPIAIKETPKLSPLEHQDELQSTHPRSSVTQNTSTLASPRTKYWVAGILSAVILSIYMQDKKIIIYK